MRFFAWAIFMTLVLTVNSFALDVVPVSLTMSGSNISFSVKNTSYGLNSNGFYARISANGKSQDIYVDPMGPQATRTVTTAAIYFGSGQASVTADADIYNWIPEGELGEANNSLTQSLNLGGSTGQVSSVDLSVVSMRVSDPYFYVTIKNLGGSTSYYSSTLRVCANGTCLDSYASTPIAGGSAEYSFNKSQFYISSSGSYYVSATIDANKVISEGNELNNTYSQYLSFSSSSSLPDLLVQNIIYQNGGIDVVVKNQGTASANIAAINVQLSRVSTTYSAVRSGSYYGGSLYAGGTTTISFIVNDVGASGLLSANLKAVVDYNNVISESNELNNELTKDIPLVQLKSDLIVEDVWVEGGMVKARIKNIGTGSMTGYHYTLFYVNGYYGYTYSNLALVSGASTVVTYSAQSFYLNPGVSYNATVYADYFGYVSESNESNNTLSKIIAVPY